jgi:putative SOS response-associated peptidase YedK
MCGRFVSPDEAAIQRAWHVGRGSPNPLNEAALQRRRFNVLPTNQVAVLVQSQTIFESSDEHARLMLTNARWGLVPPWWKQPKLPRFTINARSEEAAMKPMWRQSFRTFRCLIPAEGWYEWPEKSDIDATTGEITELGQPHYFYRPDHELFCFAGLASRWNSPASEVPVLTCAILTRGASASVAPVHDRMPVILPESDFASWTDTKLTDAQKVIELIARSACTEFNHHAVDKLVNSRKSDGEHLIEPLKKERTIRADLFAEED